MTWRKNEPKEEQKTKKCKQCNKQQPMKRYIDESAWCSPCRTKYLNTADELEEFCNNHYLPFNVDIWNQAIEKFPDNEKKAIGKYFSLMNMPQNKINTKKLADPSEQKIDDELVKFWGRFSDYSLEDYEFLQSNYESWIIECKSDTMAEKKLYKQICLQELEIQKLLEQGKSVVKERESLQKLMDSANVKPKDINAANDPSNASVLGMIIKDIEQYRPAEYFEDKKLYADFDSIKEYWTRFVTRPLKNLLTGSRDFDKEFNIDSSGGESDDII